MTIREEIIFKQGIREVKRIYGRIKNVYLPCYLRRKTGMTYEQIGMVVGYSSSHCSKIINESEMEKRRLDCMDLRRAPDMTWTVSEYAKLIRRTPSYVTEHIRLGDIEAHKHDGIHWLITKHQRDKI